MSPFLSFRRRPSRVHHAGLGGNLSLPSCSEFAALKLQLWFQRTAGELALEQICFWSHSSPHDRQATAVVNREAAGTGGDNVFKWGNTTRALCALFLRAFSTTAPRSAILHGGKGSLASSLYYVLREKHAARGADDPTWIQKVFPGHARTTNDPRLSPALFLPQGNAELGRFQVQLGRAWKDATLAAFIDNQPVAVESYAALADELERKPSPPPLALKIDVLVAADPQSASVVGGYLPIAADNLPVSAGQRTRIRLQASHAAWHYVFWIKPSGKVQTLYPWEPASRAMRDDRHAVSELLLPNGGSWSFEREPGLETLVGFVREAPLSDTTLAVLARDFRSVLGGRREWPMPPGPHFADLNALVATLPESPLRLIISSEEPVVDPILERHKAVAGQLRDYLGVGCCLSFLNRGHA